MDKKSLLQIAKFMLFSISAGIIEICSFAVFNELFKWQYWVSYVLALSISIIWNFTLNRRYTFKSAANVPIAMLKVFAFYLVFTPLSAWLGDIAESGGVNEYIILAVTLITNFITEFVFCKLVVYRNQEGTLED